MMSVFVLCKLTIAFTMGRAENDDAAYFILLSEGNDIATVQQANADVGVIPSSQSIGWR